MEVTVATLEQELEEMKSRVIELETANKDLAADLDDAEDERDELKSKVRELEQKIDDLEELIPDDEDEDDSKTSFPDKSMHDNMKRDYLLEIWDKYSPEEIETALPRRY